MGICTARQAHYRDHLTEWELIEDFLTGEDVEQHLVRGFYESTQAFEKRVQLSDWRPYTRDLLSRITSRLATKLPEVQRQVPVPDEWYESVGPKKESYDLFLVQLSEILLAFSEAWVILDPRTAKLHVVNPTFVTRWGRDFVVVKTEEAISSSPRESELLQDVYTLYTPTRFEVLCESKQGEDELLREGFYDREQRAFVDKTGQPTPPAVRIQLPFIADLGYQIARAHRALYRTESRYDAALSDSLRGLLQLAVGSDEDMAKRVTEAIKKGSLAIPYAKEYGEHKTLSVGTEGLEHGRETLEHKRQELYRVASSSEDLAATRAQTATGSTITEQQGGGALVSQIAATMESAETDILRLVAQSLDARLTERAFDVSVEWPRHFSELDVIEPNT